jgi:hypothetical protein
MKRKRKYIPRKKRKIKDIDDDSKVLEIQGLRNPWKHMTYF